MRKCTNCGSQVDDSMFNCPNCGGTNLVMEQQPGYQPGPVPGPMPGQPGPMPGQPGPMYQQPAVDDTLSGGMMVLCILFPIVGVILYFSWKNTKPNAASKALKVSLITWAVCFALGFISGLAGA